VQGVLTTNPDAVVNLVNIGRGGGNSSTSTVLGRSALSANTSGIDNTAIGSLSLTNITSGSNNIAFGRNAGRYIENSSTFNTISNNSVFLGWGTKPLADNQTNQIVIGYDATGLGSNTTVLGNTSTSFGRWFGNLLIGNSSNTSEQLQVTGNMKLTGTLTNGTHTYTLPSATGTLALTSDIPSLTNYVTLDTAQTITGAKTFTALLTGTRGSFASSGSDDTFAINHSSGSGIGLNITKGGNGEGLYVNKTSGTGNAATIIGTLNATTLVKSGGTSTQYLMADGSVSTLTNPVTGTGTSGQVAFWNGTNTQTGDNGLFWDNTNKRLGVNTNAPLRDFQVTGTAFLNGGSTTAEHTVYGRIKFATTPTSARLAVISGDATSLNLSTNNFANSVSLTYSTGNFLINTTTDSGFRLDVNGTARVTGQLTLGSTITNGTSTYTLPSNTGTLALTSELSAYLPLTGGTLTGALTGTSATFTSSVTAASYGFAIGGLKLKEYANSSSRNWILGNDYNAFGDFAILQSTTQTGSSYVSRLEISPSGNLGLGVTPSAWGNIFKSIDVGTVGSFASFATGTDIVANAYYNGTSWIYKTNVGARRYSANVSDGFSWYNAPSGTAGNAISFTQAMTLDASGNLLVGTTSGTLNGVVTIAQRSASGNGSSTLSFNHFNANNNYINFGWYGGSLGSISQKDGSAIQITAPNGLHLQPSAGNLLIGTDADTGLYKLDVNGTGRFSGALTGTSATFSSSLTLSSTLISNAVAAIQFRNSNSLRWELDRDGAESGSNAGSNLSLYRYDDSGGFLGTSFILNRATGAATFSSSVTANGNLISNSSIFTSSIGGLFFTGAVDNFSNGIFPSAGNMNFQVGSQIRMTVLTNGAVFINNLSGYSNSNSDVRYDTSTKELYYQTSSLRYKTNIINLEDSLQKITSLRPVRYQDKNRLTYSCGLIAEEVAKIIPDVVFKSKIEGFEEPQIDGINYSDIVPFLIKAIQELNEKITQLENK
jgi:hypothetical protein